MLYYLISSPTCSLILLAQLTPPCDYLLHNDLLPLNLLYCTDNRHLALILLTFTIYHVIFVSRELPNPYIIKVELDSL